MMIIDWMGKVFRSPYWLSAVALSIHFLLRKSFTTVLLWADRTACPAAT